MQIFKELIDFSTDTCSITEVDASVKQPKLLFFTTTNKNPLVF
jgi:hypothetical protein